MLINTTIPAAFLIVLGCGAAFAQVGPTASPLGITSPLGIGPGSAVPPVGVPMGALELATPGLSPPPSNSNSTACSTVGGASALFDGGGMRQRRQLATRRTHARHWQQRRPD